jgi:Ca2+-binding RTX toxin-like protein
VHWARYNGGSAAGAHFDIVTDSELKGSFNVDWSLYPGNWEKDFIIDNAYSFHAIVRYVEGTKASAVEGDYMVFPLEGGDIVTAIENVSTRGEVASVTYVNMLGVESSEPFAGINIVVTRYTTGETVIKKELHSNR